MTNVRWVTAVALVVAAVRVLAHDPVGKVTWDREVSPIIQARCVSCHRAGGKAPMSLATYEEARPWARAIREEVLTRRMPKWHAVRGYGDFANDPSLSAFEIAVITAWADGGAPRTRPAPAPAPPEARPSSAIQPPATTRSTTLTCGREETVSGRLVGLTPQLEKGAGLRVTLSSNNASEPLLWVREFDPEFAPTYWLRRPVSLGRGDRLIVEGSGTCAVTALLEARTEK